MPKKKPTAKKKRSAPQASESHQRKQERLEARRRAKEAALIAQHKQERRARAARTTVFVGVFAVLVWLVFVRQTAPSAIAGNEILSFDTSNGGQDTHTAPYDYVEDTTGVKPPVAGRYNPNPAECGIHDEKIPDDNFVHTLEHGAVGIVYNPKELKLDEIKSIEEIVNDYDTTVLSAPYPGLEDPVVVASWSRKMRLDSMNEDAIREYVDTFRDTEPAPEFNGDDPCDNTSDNAYEPPEPEPTPTPTPEATPTGKTKKGSDDGGQDKSGDGKMKKEEKGN